MAAPRFYIATKLTASALHKEVRGALMQRGWKLTYDWTSHGSVKTEGPSRLGDVGRRKLSGVFNAHAVVVFAPVGTDGAVELGAALALGRKVFIHSPTPKPFQNPASTSAAYHVGNREDPEKPSPHPSDPQLITGPLSELYDAMTDWWGVVEESLMVSRVTRVTRVDIGFYGRGRHWTSSNTEPGSAAIETREYPRGAAPEDQTGSRLVAIIDYGDGHVPIPDHVWKELTTVLLGGE